MAHLGRADAPRCSKSKPTCLRTVKVRACCPRQEVSVGPGVGALLTA
jgi:hypothetical protein